MKNSLKRRTAVAAPLTAGKSKRRTSSLLAAGLVAGVVMTLAPLPGAEQAQATAPSTLSVCSSGCGYTTIQSAITAATSGDTITVAAGTYAENLTINKSLTLLGPNSGIAALSGATRGAEAVVGANNVSHRVTVSGASTVEISGFKFVGTASGTGSDGIIVAGGGTGTIRNNWFDSLSNQGGTFSSADVYIQNGNAGAYTISGNRFDGPTGADPGDGTYNYSAINAWYLNDVTISGNRIENYGFSGVQAESVKQGTITDNFVKNVAANGIQVANGASTGPFVVQGNTIDHASAAYESYYAPDPIDKDYCWAGIRIWQNTTSAANQTVVSNNKIINTPAGCGAIGFTGTSRQTVNTIQNNSIDATNPEGLSWANYLARADEVTSNVATVRLWWPNSDILVGGTVVVSDLGAPYDGTHVVTAVGSWLDATSYSYKTVSFAVSASNQATSSVTKGTVVALARAQAPIPAANNWWGSATGPGTSGSSLNSAGAGATTSPWIVSYTDDPAKAGKTGFWPTVITASCPTNCYVGSAGSDSNDGTSGSPFATIQHAVTAVSSGGTVHVAAGTYNENVQISQPLTLLGANASQPGTGARGAESIISTSNSSGNNVTVDVVNATGVTVDGFTIRQTAAVTCSTCAAFGVQVGPGSNGAVVTNNIIDGITTSGTFGGTQAGNPIGVNVAGNNSLGSPSNVHVTQNLIENIQSTGTQHKSASGIQVGNSASPGGATGNVIQSNHITNIQTAWGAYGVIFNRTAGTPGAVVQGNTIDTLHGQWAHAIGLEGPVPSMTITNNAISNISANSSDSEDIYTDATNNTGVTTATVTNNSLGGGTSAGIVSVSTGALAAAGNWWGCAEGPGATGCSVTATYGGAITTAPWIVSYTDDPTKAGQPGFWPTAITASSAPSITSADHTAFTTGSAGSFTVTGTGAPAPTFSETGTLPAGVSFNSTTGVLSGTPTASGSFSITMGANNGVGSGATQPFTLTVNGAPAITSADNATFTTGSAGSFTVTATGTPAPTFSETGTLPAGVSFNSTTGVLSGTPTASGSFSITMGAANGVGSNASQSFTLTVNAAPTITSGASKVFVKGVAGSFTVTATGYPAPTFSETGTLPTGITLNSSGVLSGTSTQTGSFPVTMTATNGVGTDATQNFTVNVVAAPVFTSANNATFTTAGSNSFTVSASGFPAPTFAVTTGTLPSGVTLNSTTGVLSGTPAATGVTSVTITATNAVSNATQSFTLTANAGPVITSANSTGFVATVAGTFTVTASGYPAPTFTETGALPAGITLNATTGVLSGTTTADGTYVIALKATNGVGSGGTQVFTLTVATAVPTFTSASSGTAVAGTPYSFTIRAIGASPITMSTASTSAITAAGLTFTDNGDGTATVAGTPLASAAGLKTWTWKAQNAAGKTLQGFDLAINLAPSITSAASKSVKTGVAFSMTITSKGFPVATLSATGLPAGVTLVNIGSGKGTLAGTMPAGVHTFTITASNGVLPNATQLFTLTGK